MPLPSNYSTRTVHGRWIAFPDGAPTTGTVTFRASVAHLVSSSDELVILTRPISADLDGNGEATVELPTTSDPDISPTGFTYAVTETLGANGTERAYSIDVPEDTVNLELATVTPVAAVDDASPYLLVADRGSPDGVAALDSGGLVPRDQLSETVDTVQGQTGEVTLNASDVGALPDTFTAPVQSVNTFTGDISLTAGDVDAAPDPHSHDTEYAALGHDHDFPVESVDGRTGAVTLDDLYASTGHNHDADYAAAGHTHPEPDHPVDSVDGRTGTVTLDDLYADEGHTHAHPVTSVNTETGDVVLDAGDVGASPSGHDHDAAYAAADHSHPEPDHPVDSVDGRTGAVTLDDLYADEGHNHPDPDFPVDSVNGETGDVVLDAGDVGASPSGHDHDADYAASGHTHDHPVDSVDGRTGSVTLGDLYADSGHNHDAAYAAAGHGHDYPVDSVNGETGTVNLSASDVGAAPSGHDHDADYAASGHGHDTFTGSSVDIESSNNLADGDPAPFRLGNPSSGGELLADGNQLFHRRSDGTPGTLFIGSPIAIGGGAAAGVGSFINAIDFGFAVETTDGDGQFAVSHNLGMVPVTVQLTVRTANGLTYAQNTPAQMTSSQFVVQCRDTRDGTPNTGVSIGVFWLAIA